MPYQLIQLVSVFGKLYLYVTVGPNDLFGPVDLFGPKLRVSSGD